MPTVIVAERAAGPPAARSAWAAAHARLAAWSGPALLLGAIFLAVRVIIARSPLLAETYYDEALTGLMSLQILRGIPQVFYWGQPYLGALDAYLAAVAFRLFGPSTLALRLGTAWVSIFWTWAAWRIGRRIAGEPWGFLAGAQIALPPIFLTYLQLSSHAEGVAMALATVALAAAVTLLDSPPDRRRAAAWAALGIAGGLAWWESQMAAMMLAAASVGLLVARPRLLRGPGPYVALALGVLASLPFWIWNLRHEWATFIHLATWGDPLPEFGARIPIVVDTVARSLRGAFWDGRAVPLPRWAVRLGLVAALGVYLPAVVLAGARTQVWARRLWRRERPFEEPLDLVVLAFWLTVVAHLVTWFGTSGILRYVVTFHGVLAILTTATLARLARTGRLGRTAAVALATALITFNLVTHVAFVQAGARTPGRPVDAAIAALVRLGVTGCYADSRIAQVLTFESSERVLCADYEGFRNFAYLQAVDAIEDPARVAIVTHRVLKLPEPAQMRGALTRVGAASERTVVGDYEIFHHFAPTGPPVRPIPPAGWRARASVHAADAPLAFDRAVWTRWWAPNQPGQWFEVDLGAVRTVAQVSLLVAPAPGEAPMSLAIATSEDGRRWVEDRTERPLMPGLHWWKGHPRRDESGRVIVRLPPRPARFVRLTNAGPPFPHGIWGIGELFVYEAADTPWTPPAEAAAALETARRELDHWMDDPGGPHPRRAPVTYEHRRAQVRWGPVFEAVNRAMALAPEWEEVHHLYGQARDLALWDDTFDVAVERARTDAAWTEVVRWATAADAAAEESWRAGREAALAEALEHLGQADAAAAVRARPAPVPSRPLQAQFGQILDLEGIDFPAVAHPGETVTVRYYWRLRDATGYDYWAFLHISGLAATRVNHDQPIGTPGFPLPRWAVGERVRQTVTFTVPPDAAPGAYPVRMGVWLPSTGKRLRVAAAVPVAHRELDVGPLTILPGPPPDRSGDRLAAR